MGVGGYGWGGNAYMGEDLWQRPLTPTNTDNDLIDVDDTLFRFEQQSRTLLTIDIHVLE